ncbi:hypothetical protein J1C67_08610 [Clostridium gasigenes]|uniref:hypothetical protein n=1 Tax=Clostridium gasigenes TaxID=94869 RepID=UPI0014385765|nr:hypothetical protein [Clostridium gasigenes]NKF06496.1 hypothetical protein [Clostridium gasigenes]QSW21144.1 hypothetical protein J1C67_08610 [Clostridium gasigenes]
MNTLSSLVYMNIDLVQDLSSLLIDGYLDSKSIREAHDETTSKKIQSLTKNQLTNDLKKTKNDKDINKVTDENCLEYVDNTKALEGRTYGRNEVTYKKVYSLFYFYNILIPTMKRLNLIRSITAKDIIDNNVYDGEFVEFHGNMSINILSNTIENTINILKSYNIKTLDERVYTKDIGPLTYTMIVDILTYINKELARNNTFDCLVNMGNSNAVLNLNFNYVDKKGALYDIAQCNCKVFGKVCKVATKKTEHISLLRKTGLDSYYETLLTSINPYLILLNDSGYLIPLDIITDIYSPAIQVIPVGISV